MASNTRSELFKLPADERAELAMALWESLTDAEREGEMSLTNEQRADLDRRWEEHLRDPDSGIPWNDVKRRLQGRK